MDTLAPYLAILKQAIAEYAKSPANGYAYFTESPDGHFFTVIDVYQRLCYPSNHSAHDRLQRLVQRIGHLLDRVTHRR